MENAISKNCGNRSATASEVGQPIALRRGRRPKPSAKALENQKNSSLLRIPARDVEDEYEAHAPDPPHQDLIGKLEFLTGTVGYLSNTIPQQNEKFECVQMELREIKDQKNAL